MRVTEFYHYFLSVKFVVLTADQFVGDDDGPLATHSDEGLTLESL